ncbi:MAG: hypothetical protein JWP70_1114 [Leifsonia sp.]|nr:hypothetical protein [Leifsonia sp.]MDQ1587865.1 acyl-CoA thioesterase [Microbacteriaceae bacterium]
MRPPRTLVVLPALLAALALTACTSASASSGPARSSNTATASAARPAVAFLGDSLTAGLFVQPSQAWPVTLSSEENWDGVNVSCSGAGFVARGDCGTYNDMVARAVAAHPSLVIVPASSNDLGSNQATLKAEMTATMNRLRAALPGATIAGLNAIWNDGEAPSELSEISNDLADAVTAAGGTYVDIGEPVYGHPEWMQPDTVHYTQAGYDAVAQAVNAALKNAGVHP